MAMYKLLNFHAFYANNYLSSTHFIADMQFSEKNFIFSRLPRTFNLRHLPRLKTRLHSSVYNLFQLFSKRKSSLKERDQRLSHSQRRYLIRTLILRAAVIQRALWRGGANSRASGPKEFRDQVSPPLTVRGDLDQ